MIAAALAVLLSCAQAEAPGRFAAAEVELTGPLETLAVELAPDAATVLRANLAAGERATASVPLLASPQGREPVLRERPDSEGRARWIGWLREGFERLDDEWRALPSGLRSRPRVSPLASDPRDSVPPAALFGALALVAIALAGSRKTVATFAVCAAGSLALYLAFALPPEPSPPLRVLEGDGATQRWLAVDVAWERFDAPVSAPLRWETEPAHARVEAEFAIGSERWSLLARRAVLRRIARLEPGSRAADPGANRWGRFEETWTRSSDGRWSAHGVWEVGEPLPTGRAEDPPGRFNPALPQGASVLLARLAPGGFSGSETPAGEVWLRWIGPSSAVSTPLGR